MERWGIEDDGRRIEVEREESGISQLLRLVVDGERVAECTTSDRKAQLAGDAVAVEVRLKLLGTIRDAAILDADGRTALLLDPPAGTRAARLAELQRERPVLFAARHVVVAVGSVVIPLLGIGALFTLALPNLDLPDMSLPLPHIGLPLPHVDLDPPEWLKSVAKVAKFAGPVLIAIAIAANEVERQKRNRKRRTQDG